MKKLITFLMMSAIVALTSCSKEEVGSSGVGQEVSARFSVQLPNQAVKSRAAYADPALTDMRVYLVVNYNGTEVYSETKTGQSFASPVTFDLRLVTGKDYQVAVWADFGDAYYTITNGKVAMASTTIIGSDNKRDAYFTNQTISFAAANEVKNIELKRPFGLIKINTTDNNAPAVKNAGLRVATYQLTGITAATELNLLDGTVGDEKALTIGYGTASTAVGDGATKELSFDYIFAGETQTPLTDFVAEYKNSTGDVITSYNFTNIPIRRNYITNITGNLLTKQGKISVTIEQCWETPNSDVIIVDPNEDIFAQINQIIKTSPDGNSVNIVVPNGATISTISNSIVIPDDIMASNTPAISIDLSKATIQSGAVINIGDQTHANPTDNYAGTITFTVPSSTPIGTFNVTVPNGTVIIDGGAYSNVTAITGVNTFIINEKSSIDNLEIKQGNVEIYGSVKDIKVNVGDGKSVKIKNFGTITGVITTQSGLYTLVAEASTAEELRAAMVNPNLTGVILKTDVSWVSSNPNLGASDNQDAFKIGVNDAIDYYVTRPMDGFELDGGGHIISGVAYNNIFAVYAHNVTIKNVIIEQTDAQKTTKANGGLSIYRSTGVNLENVTIRNTGKAGLTINAGTASAKNLSTNGNAWGGVDVTKGGSPTGGNKPIFTFDNTCMFADFPQVYVSKDRTGEDFEVNAPASWDNGAVLIAGKLAYIYSSTPITSKVTEIITNSDKVGVDPMVEGLTANSLVQIGVSVFQKGVNAYSTIEAGLSAVNANGTVKVAAGTYSPAIGKNYTVGTTSKTGVTLEGTATNRPVLNATLTMYGGTTLKNFEINYAQAVVPSSVNAICLLIGNNQTFENVKWNDSGKRYAEGATQNLYPIMNNTGNGDGLTVKNCEFIAKAGTSDNSYYKAIYLNPGPSSLMSNVTMENNTFTYILPFSCDSWMPNLSFKNNNISTNMATPKDVGFYRSVDNGDAAKTKSSDFSQELKNTINMCLNDNTWSNGKRVKTWGTGGTIEVTSTLN